MPDRTSPAQRERSVRASIASNLRWALVPDRAEATAPARHAFFQQFLGKVDAALPGLPDAERYRRAESLKKAYFAALALKSAKVRRDKSAGKSNRPVTEKGGAV